MTTNQVLAGVGLILVLAVGSQVVASQLRIPARGFDVPERTRPLLVGGQAWVIGLACGLRSALASS